MRKRSVEAFRPGDVAAKIEMKADIRTADGLCEASEWLWTVDAAEGHLTVA
jgi:hypothetical protein